MVIIVKLLVLDLIAILRSEIYLEDNVLWRPVHLDPLKHAEVTPRRLLESFYAIQVFFC